MTWCVDIATAIGGRPEQQDRAALFDVPGRSGGRLAVLADGMGGQQLGGLAAQTVIEVAGRELPRRVKDRPREAMLEFCDQAHETIRRIGREHGVSPASTCTAIYLSGDEAYWVHVGDSRLYHFSGEQLLHRTEDHTLDALMQEADSEAPNTGARERQDNRLYMCLGGNNELDPIFGATAVGEEDWFLLCSDGFWSQVHEEEAASSVVKASADATLAEELVGLAAQRGGVDSDNVSLVLATRARRRPKRAWWQFKRAG